jgi:outer membrane protein assembly factor BamB
MEWNRRQLSLPVQVTSTPPKAEVWKDGGQLGVTPLVIRHGLTEELTLTVKEAGYLPGKIKIPTEGQSGWASVELVQTRLPRWTCSLTGVLDAPIQATEGRLVLNNNTGEVTNLETATGRVVWSRKIAGLRGSCLSPGSSQAQFLYTVLQDGHVMRLSAEDGKESWNRNLGTPLTGSALLNPSENALVVATGEGNVYGLSADRGEVRWIVQVADAIKWVLPVEGGYLCLGTDAAHYLCPGKSDEHKPWRRNLISAASARPVLSDRRAYIPGADGTLTVLDLRNGALISSESVSSASLVAPALWEDTLIVADISGNVQALALPSGKKLWQHSLRESVSSGGSCAGGTYYIGTDRGTLTALDVATGNVKWQAMLDGKVQSPPVITDQLCLTTTRTGTVYAISLK